MRRNNANRLKDIADTQRIIALSFRHHKGKTLRRNSININSIYMNSRNLFQRITGHSTLIVISQFKDEFNIH